MGLAEELRAYGALPSQLVDINRKDESRVLSYLDLRAESPGWRRPVVVENAGRPCVHVFDARDGATAEEVGLWCWRVALRGDGAWVGVLEPGRLCVYRADVAKNKVSPRSVTTARPGDVALTRFLNDVSAGQNDLARRRYLMKLLEGSAKEAINLGLSENDALSLVGRGLFWRFLVDRGLLEGLRPLDVCWDEGAKQWEQCFDTKKRALRTFRWLDTTFNGGLLPFERREQEFPADVFTSVLANIAYGATAKGQMRLPTDWQEVNFAYVPVGLLSEVYETFAHSLDPAKAARTSIYYTPSHLVDFVVAQALEQLPKNVKPRVLDPAAGAGVFLVTAFRQLVERDWRNKHHRPKRRRIREILNTQLAGFDIDVRALRLAELALYLTALEIDPEPKPLAELKFDRLRDKVLFDVSEVAEGSLGPIDARFRNKFDLMIGNPPWTAKSKGGEQKKVWVEHSLAIVRERLGEPRASRFDLPDTNMDLPFLWRAMEWTKEGGRIAVMTHARWLFGISDRATQARNDLLEATRVTGILNGSALRLTNVWPNVNAPWCVVFATNEPPRPFEDAAFQFISPGLDVKNDAAQARVRIDWLDASAVLTSEAVEVPWTLKTRFRGNRLAARALDSMRQRGDLLGKYLGRLGTEFKNGYQVGGKEGTQADASHLKKMPNLKGSGRLGFVVDAGKLPKFSRATLLRPRDRSIYKAPLLLVGQSISADRLAVRASRADADVMYHESFHGVSLSGLADSDLIARYLQIWFQSCAMVFVELLTDGRYGIERDVIYLESLNLLPVVPVDALSPAQRARVVELSNKLAMGFTSDLADKIDTFVFDTYALSPVERDAVRDTLATARPSKDAKRRSVEEPKDEERERFIDMLADSMGCVLSASGFKVVARERNDLMWKPWRVLEVCVSEDGSWSGVQPPMEDFLKAADLNGASLVVVRADPSTWFVGLMDRYALWTPTRARLLATDLIAERSS
jgi:hypothetical protein